MQGARKTVFTTGGAGYVGSHTVAALLEQDKYDVIVADNYANTDRGEQGKPACLTTLENLTGKFVTFYEADLTDKASLRKIFSQHKIHCVIHFAALKAVGESVALPLNYYKNNVGGTLNLLEVMEEFSVSKLVFSSSAMVYGQPEYLPLDERHPTGQKCTNPYGKTKYFIEEVLKDLANADSQWDFVTLRYFNPVGAHKSGLIGENPKGIPNNLMPYISKVALGQLPELKVFGSDYNTKDGTGVRDYIHVIDLAMGHLAALNKIMVESVTPIGYKVYNLGTGQGYSVLEILKAFENASKLKIPYKVVDRRAGDVATLLSDPHLANEELGWKAERRLADMCDDTWRWLGHFNKTLKEEKTTNN